MRRKPKPIGHDRWGKIYRYGLYEDMEILQREILLNERLKARLARLSVVASN